MHIDEIINGLSGQADADKPHHKAELIIRLVMWLRFSGQPTAQEIACMAGVLSYIDAQYSNSSLIELPPDAAALLQRTLQVGPLKSVLLGQASEQPIFDLFAEYGDEYHEYPYIADVVKFLLWYAPESNDKRQQASLQKAYYFLMDEGFSHWAHFSRRYFIKQWALHRNASAFLYVAYHHLGKNLLLDPRDPSFREKVDALAADPALIPDLLMQAKWVGERLQERLHRKAQQGLELPTFPASVKSREISPVKLEGYVYQSLANYRSDIDTPED